MTLPRLISFSGKKGCGKSLLASICKEQFGYTRISFANNLKLLTCQCLDITLNELNSHKDDVIKPIKINITVGKFLCLKLSLKSQKS